MQKSINLLVDLSVYACSVIIIGVGEEGEFDNMYELSSDKLVDETGRLSARHLVQFIEFQKAQEIGDLADQVLKQVPPQFMQFMQLHNI